MSKQNARHHTASNAVSPKVDVEDGQPLPFSNRIRNPDITDQARKDIVLQWALRFKMLHDQFKGTDRLVDRAFAYLDTHCGIAVPVVDEKTGQARWIQYDRGNDNPSLYITVLIESDAHLHPEFADKVGKCSYVEADHMLYLTAEKISPIWQALILYWGLLHGIYYLEHPGEQDHPKEAVNWKAAYEVSRDLAKVVRRFYGKPYSNVVDRLSKRYERHLSASQLPLYHSKEISRKQLEQIYGLAASDYERQLQENTLKLNALFRALDRIHPGGDKQAHYAVVEWFYGQGDKIAKDPHNPQ